MNTIYRAIFLMVLSTIALSPVVSADSKQESYNPTEPEVQLGDIKELSIEESGAVNLDTKSSQAILRDDGLTEIEGVKGKGNILYVLDKESQDIISLHYKGTKIASESGSEVQVKFVDSLVGKNGVADSDGFKSNIVRSDIIPKTGIPQQYSSLYLPTLLILLVVSVGMLYFTTKRQSKA